MTTNHSPEGTSMRDALHQISLCSQNSASSKEECGRIARAALSQEGGQAGAVALEVWFGSMPESNGRENWTVTLRRKATPDNASKHDTHRLMSGVTVYRSEYKDRARYEADRLRFLLGEIDTAPNILEYDADLHSGYTEPKAQAGGGVPPTGKEGDPLFSPKRSERERRTPSPSTRETQKPAEGV